MLLRLMNFFRGERHFYSIAAIQSLMAVGTAVHFCWYDIACRWSLSFEKWLQKQEDPAILDKAETWPALSPPGIVTHTGKQGSKGFGGSSWCLRVALACFSLSVVIRLRL